MPVADTLSVQQLCPVLQTKGDQVFPALRYQDLLPARSLAQRSTTTRYAQTHQGHVEVVYQRAWAEHQVMALDSRTRRSGELEGSRQTLELRRVDKS
jgi:hypothetical protein